MRRRFRLPFALILSVAAAGLISAAWSQAGSAQTTSNRVGLVVQFKDGTISKSCVEIPGAEAKGYDVLLASGLQLSVDFDAGLGAGICKIENDGCSADQCFCDMPNYWSYWHLSLNSEGQPSWVYSVLGASNYTVRAGDVEGWHYGLMAPPGEMPSFTEICTESPTPSPTSGENLPAPTATTAPPTAKSVNPTRPPQWATAVIVGPTYTPLPTRTAAPILPAAASPTAVPPTEPAPAFQGAADPATEQESPPSAPSPTWTSLPPTHTAEPALSRTEPPPAPTAVKNHKIAVEEPQAEISDPGLEIPQPPAPADPPESASRSTWILVLGGLAGLGSFAGFFLILLGALTAILLLRRR